jgi:uncharacterized protein
LLVDANLLLFAADADAPHHETARSWLNEQLGGSRRVGLPWNSLGAFLRIITNPRASINSLDPEAAWGFVDRWLSSNVAWVPVPSHGHAEILGDLVQRHRISGNLIPDAQLVALAIEHGLTIYSNDSDFARFPEISWVDPLRG